jgi:hypothetical protein
VTRPRTKRSWRQWTEAEHEVLRREFPHRPTHEVAAMLGREVTTVSQHAYKLGLRKTPEYLATPASGRINFADPVMRGAGSRFRKGNASWNKGRTWHAGGRSVETQFKAGHVPHTHRPVGSYRINPEGYLQQKISDEPGSPHLRWRSVHRLVWEAEHGPMPEGHVVVFRGPITTVLEEITLDRVELISRQQLMERNTVHNYPEPLLEVIRAKGGLMKRINTRLRKKAQTA